MMRIRVRSRVLGHHPTTRVWDVDLVDPGFGRGPGEVIQVGTADDWPTAMEHGWTAWRFAHVSWRNNRSGGGVHDVQMPQPERRPRGRDS